MRLLAAILLLVSLCIGLQPRLSTARESVADRTVISGGGLARPVTLAIVDHQAFMRRLDLPPLLQDEPPLRGPSYTVTSPYWDAAVRDNDETEPVVDEAATYYPEGGFVRTRQGGKDVWTVLNTAQKAILNRYIRYAPELPVAPSVFDVLRSAGRGNEGIGISIGAVNLAPAERARFWQAALAASPRTMSPAESSALLASEPGSTWIVFNLPEGRAVSMRYAPATGTLYELQEAMAGIAFSVPADWLAPVLGSQPGSGAGSGPLQPMEISQQPGQGSPLWWVLMVGGGAVAIAVAVLIERRLHGRTGTGSPRS